jgi:maleamate amidohydrolase
MDAYRAVTYGTGTIGPGRKAAVIVVDLQRAFTDPSFPIGQLPMIQAATERTAELLSVARAHNVPVAKCYTAYGSPADMPHWKVQTVRESLFFGDPGTEMDPRIHDAAYDFTFVKSGPSMFFMTPLVTFLTRQQVDTVIVTGCTTSGCVRASIIDAFSFGYRVLVPEDCCGDADRVPHEQNLIDVGRRYADITDANEMIKLLAKVES